MSRAILTIEVHKLEILVCCPDSISNHAERLPLPWRTTGAFTSVDPCGNITRDWVDVDVVISAISVETTQQSAEARFIRDKEKAERQMYSLGKPDSRAETALGPRGNSLCFSPATRPFAIAACDVKYDLCLSSVCVNAGIILQAIAIKIHKVKTITRAVTAMYNTPWGPSLRE